MHRRRGPIEAGADGAARRRGRDRVHHGDVARGARLRAGGELGTGGAGKQLKRGGHYREQHARIIEPRRRATRRGAVDVDEQRVHTRLIDLQRRPVVRLGQRHLHLERRLGAGRESVRERLEGPGGFEILLRRRERRAHLRRLRGPGAALQPEREVGDLLIGRVGHGPADGDQRDAVDRVGARRTVGDLRGDFVDRHPRVGRRRIRDEVELGRRLRLRSARGGGGRGCRRRGAEDRLGRGDPGDGCQHQRGSTRHTGADPCAPPDHCPLPRVLSSRPDWPELPRLPEPPEFPAGPDCPPAFFWFCRLPWEPRGRWACWFWPCPAC